MFTVKNLVRVNPIRFNVKPLVRKNLAPAQERALTISALCETGLSYAAAIREFDSRQKAAKRGK